MSIFSIKRFESDRLSICIMANIKIPKEAIPTLRTIAELDSNTFDSVLSIIAAEPPTLNIHQFIKRISPKLDEAKKETIFEILAVIIPLFAVKENKSVSIHQLADDIGGAATGLGEEKFPIEKVEILKSRLQLLLGLDKPLAVIAKANEVMTEHEKTFCGARVLSDIRSVFAEAPDKVSGAMVVHMLEIGYHQLGKHQEFFVAMDNDDLKKLKGVIERAEKKTLALRSLIENSNTPYLEV